MKRSGMRLLISSLLVAAAVLPISSWGHAQSPTNQDGKPAGVIRIGVAMTTVQMGPAPAGVNPSENVRGMIIKYLTGPAFDIMPLAAQLPVQVDAEARQKGCDFVIYSALSAKQKGSSGLGFLKGAAQMSTMIPMLGAAHGAAGTIAGAATGTVLSGAAGAAAMVRAKAEISLEYRVVAPGNPTPVLSDVAKAKAAQDGEDVITPLVEQAATAIVSKLQQKN